jgi:Rieske Fe-S protein
MPCERCLNRRDFLATGGVALAAAVAACGDGTVSGIAGAPIDDDAIGSTRVVVKVDDFPGLASEGTLVKVSSFFAAKRTGAATFDAFSMACTHEGCLINVTAGLRFDCPCHGSRFDNNGQVVQGPAAVPLQKLPTSYNPTTDELTIN